MGGLVGGSFYSVLDQCTSSAQVSGNGAIGGLAGTLNSASLTNCSASGDVTGTGNEVGGLVGSAKRWTQVPELIDSEEIVNCYATGNVHSDSSYGGGLIGRISAGTVQNCYATGTVSGDSSLGGLIGLIDYVDLHSSLTAQTTISSCYATGNVQGLSNYIGGLIGRSKAILVKDCYAHGYTDGSSYIGGLIGYNYSSDVVCCFSTGPVTGTDSMGGLIGGNGGTYLSYWDTDASQVFTSSGGKGKTTPQMMSMESFRGWGDGIWVLDETNDYPHLAWERTTGTPIVDTRTYSGGSGTPQDPYQISTVDDLVAVGLYTQDWDKSFILTDDIVLDPPNLNDPSVYYDNANFNKIGFRSLPFTGSFNGNFHSISNLQNQNTDEGYNGLFGCIQGSGPDDVVAENIVISNPVFAGYRLHGGLAGYATDAKISRCGIENFLLSKMASRSNPAGYFGGLVGSARNVTIAASYAEGTFNLGFRGGAHGRQGGLVGDMFESTVEDSYAIATFNTAGYDDGGFVGRAWDSRMIDCYSVPSVAEYVYIDGFVGDAWNTPVNYCYFRSGSGINYGPAGSPLSDSSMKQQANFMDWDFENIWWIDEGNDYPRLWWDPQNTAPVAVAGADVTVYAFAGGIAEVQLDGTGSTDADGDVLAYYWYNDANELIATGAEPNVLVGVGKYEVTLIVNDGFEDSEPNSVFITVLQGNTPPVADAGADQTVYASLDGYALVQLDGTDSNDVDGDALGYYWYDGNDLIATGAEPNVLFGVGEYEVTLIVNDGIEDSEPNSCVITVVDPFEALAGDIAELVQHNGIANSLLAKLDAALKILEDSNENNDGAAVGSLGAFINAVNAQRGKKISEADADSLIAAAQQIINML
ncbi:MAG: GLUG motif-containing protein [Planctomycetota bacterium]